MAWSDAARRAAAEARRNKPKLKLRQQYFQGPSQVKYGSLARSSLVKSRLKELRRSRTTEITPKMMTEHKKRTGRSIFNLVTHINGKRIR